MGFWKKAFYNASILMVIAVVLTLAISQSLMSMLFTIQTKDLMQNTSPILIQFSVFVINFLYIITVLLFLANLTKIAKFMAAFSVAIHLLFVFFTMAYNYSITHNAVHITNMGMIVIGLLSLGVYIKMSRDKAKLEQNKQEVKKEKK